MMWKPEGQRALAMKVIMRQIQANKRKPSGRGNLEGILWSRLGPRLRPSPFILQFLMLFQLRALPMTPLPWFQSCPSSAAVEKRPEEKGTRSPNKKCPTTWRRGDPRLIRGVITTSGSMRIPHTERCRLKLLWSLTVVFFPHDEEWLQFLSIRKFYEVSLSSLYRVCSIYLLFSSVYAILPNFFGLSRTSRCGWSTPSL